MRLQHFIIYGLRDPRDKSIRYVGKSTYGIVRAKEHGMLSRLKGKSYKNYWIKQLHALGLDYEIVILQELSTTDGLYEAEQAWIAIGRQAGMLTNLADGGPGSFGCKWSSESRARLAKSRTGIKFTEEHRKNLVKAARQRSKEHYQKVADANRGRKLTPEHIAKVAAAGRGRKASEETCRKRSETMKATIAKRGNWWKGRRHDSDTKQKMSKAAIRRWSIRRCAMNR